MKIILFFLCIPFLACSQPQENDWVKQHQEDYKNVVKEFYTLLHKDDISIQEFSKVYWGAEIQADAYLFLKDSLKLKDSDLIYPSPYSALVHKRVSSTDESASPSYVFKKMKPYLHELINGLSKEEIFKIIDKAEVSDEGLQFGVYLGLSFSETKKIYFGLGADMPTIIDAIWLSDGTLLDSKVCNESPVQKLLLVGIINDKDGYTNVREAPSNEAKVIDKITDKEYFYYVPNSNSDWWQVSRKDDIKAIVGYVHKSRILKYSTMPNEIKQKIAKDRKSD